MSEDNGEIYFLFLEILNTSQRFHIQPNNMEELRNYCSHEHFLGTDVLQPKWPERVPQSWWHWASMALKLQKKKQPDTSLSGSGTYEPESDQALRSITLQDIKIEKQIKWPPRDAISQIETVGNYGTKSLILSPNKFRERKEKPSIN